MPSLETARRIASIKNNGAKTIGQIYKENSDFAMDFTWENDLQSQIAYLYDYKHDDSPSLCKGMNYENTTKYPIAVKFIKHQSQTLAKDQIEYLIQFKPSQKTSDFVNTDHEVLQFYQKDYTDKYNAEFPIGLYIDLKDDQGFYRRWLICQREISNQFTKYIVLPCQYQYMWIEEKENQRIKRQMWGVARSMNSYNSGYIKHCSLKIPLIAGNPLEPYKLQRRFETKSSVNVRKL